MNPPKCDGMDYINFLTGMQKCGASQGLNQGISDRWHKRRRRRLGHQLTEKNLEKAAFHALDAWQIEAYHRALK